MFSNQQNQNNNATITFIFVYQVTFIRTYAYVRSLRKNTDSLVTIFSCSYTNLFVCLYLVYGNIKKNFFSPSVDISVYRWYIGVVTTPCNRICGFGLEFNLVRRHFRRFCGCILSTRRVWNCFSATLVTTTSRDAWIR